MADFLEVMKKESSLKLKPGVLNIIWFSSDGIAYSVAHKLLEEGNNVVIAEVQDKKDIDLEDSDEETKRRRLSLYNGILDKKDSRKVLSQMEKMSAEEKSKWIIWFEFNDLAPLAEKVLKMGFTKGLFPTQDDFNLEKDRDAAKSIVQEHYPHLDTAEVNEFSKVEEALKFLEETDKLWVVKGNSNNAKTIVPSNDDPELSKQILMDALESHKSDYEDEGGFILEEKIIDGIEFTPQIVFLDGQPVFTDIDIENKPIGAGNVSVQTGAMHSLVFKTSIKDKANDIAFPSWVYEQAKKHKGIFIVDAGILMKGDRYYFTEFCFQRFGFDSFFAEMAMSGSATDFFTSLFAGKNPLKSEYGIAVRALNMHRDGGEKGRRVLEGITMTVSDWENTWLYEVKNENEKLVNTGIGWDLAVFTGAADELEDATDIAYEALESYAFEDLYHRPKSDFLSTEYQSSVMNRFQAIKNLHD